jgi:hypothetical protein
VKAVPTQLIFRPKCEGKMDWTGKPDLKPFLVFLTGVAQVLECSLDSDDYCIF